MSNTSQPITDVLYVESFLSSRKKEISIFENEIKDKKRLTTIFQRLPKHMRRRAMSHSINRMPCSLRTAHFKQLEKNKALKKLKRPRKKYRRRTKVLLRDYNRRGREYVWLETHIWHAKRFRMVKKWNYKIAESSYNKTFRACYRATSSHCLVQDISYYCCIEVQGPLEFLLDGFKLLSSTECGPTICAKCWLHGSRQGNAVLFHKNAYPRGVIGNVDFIWKPPSSSVTIRTVWIWSHPSYYSELLDELVNTFNVTRLDEMDTSSTETKDSLKTVLYNPKYRNDSLNIDLISLKDNLNRFRLTGPLSNAVLSKVFHQAISFSDPPSDIESDESITKIKEMQRDINNWWKTFNMQNKYQDGNIFDILDRVSDPAQFPPYSVIGSFVKDPRLFLPHKRGKAASNHNGKYCFTKPLPQWCHSEMWNSYLRDICGKCMVPTFRIDNLRRKLLVSGNDEQLSSLISMVLPILLVQRPGVSHNDTRLDYGSGWDIVFPAKWAMPVWMALILNGARPGALRETRIINFERKAMFDVFVDSEAGVRYYKELQQTSTDRYFKMPPNRRVNYIKCGFPMPFHYSWNSLTLEWIDKESTENVFVLRNIFHLELLKSDLRNLKMLQKSYAKLPDWLYHSRCIIPVSVKMMGKGKIAPGSHICLPTDNDIKSYELNNKYSGPIEDMHNDVSVNVRKQTKAAHKKYLRYLRKERIKEKIQRKSEVVLREKNVLGRKTATTKRIKRKEPPTADLVKEYNIRMRNLYLPQHDGSIRYHCKREVMGFVVNGGFSFIESTTMGQGYITFQSLISLIKFCHSIKFYQPVVLVRSPPTMTYTYCLLNIVY